MTSRLPPRYEVKCVQYRCFQCGSVPLRSDIKRTELPHANILIPLERQLIALQLFRWQFLYNETLHQTFRPLLSKLSERRQISVFDPHFKEDRGGVEPGLMARWKARANCNWTSFSISYRWGATRQNVSILAAFRRGCHFEPRFQGEGVVSGEYFWFLQN